MFALAILFIAAVVAAVVYRHATKAPRVHPEFCPVCGNVRPECSCPPTPVTEPI